MTIESLVNSKWKNRFTFIGYIGSGGQGEVALLYDYTLKMNFVCKAVPINDDESKGRFNEELKSMYTSYHENVVRIFSHFVFSDTSDTTGFILMEHIDGNDIFSYLNTNPSQVMSIFVQCIEGFKHLEKNRIIHRDLRNKNILVSENGQVKLIDFGYSKTNIDFGGTNSSLILNWPASEPEEVINKENNYSMRTDIYYLGHIFQNIISKLHLDEHTEFLDTIVSKMCEYKVDSRYQNFNDILEDVYNVFETTITDENKTIFREMASELSYTILGFYNKSGVFDFNPKSVIRKLKSLIHNTDYYDVITNYKEFAECFFVTADVVINGRRESTGEYEGGDYYRPIYQDVPIAKKTITDFTRLLSKSNIEASKILKNIYFKYIKNLPIHHRYTF